MKDKNKKVLKELAIYIQNNWQLKAKMVRCSRPPDKAHKQEQRFKAPYAFNQCDRDKRKGTQLVVLVYFDGEKDYKVFAYPCKLAHEIKWIRKPDSRMTFDSDKLNPRFKFVNIKQFKKEFRRRFP